MLAQGSLILLAVLMLVQFKRILDKSYLSLRREYEKAASEYEHLIQRRSKLEEEIVSLQSCVTENTALYEITKEVCRSLEQREIFASFRELASRYVRFRDLEFLKSRPVPLTGSDYLIVPLSLQKASLGYLVATGISEGSWSKFHILAQQFLLGLKRAVLYEKLQQLSVSDSLTQVFNRRYLLARLSEEIERCARFNYEFSFLMIDVDHFKGFNDKYGHLVGDAILREVARAIKENTRQIDLVARYGGEEFCVLMPETNRVKGYLAAERIRRSLEQRDIIAYDEKLRASVSIGLATFPLDARYVQPLIERADEALYRAKAEGRNRVC